MKLSISADAYVLTSTIKVADIELLKKSNPDALKLTNKDGEAIFAISFSEGNPSIAPFGVTFGGKTRDDNGYATITGIIPSDVQTTDAAKEFVAEKFGGVVAHLTKLEESVSKAAASVRDAKKKLIDGIVVA